MKRWEYIQKDATKSEVQDKNTVAKLFINTDDNTNRFYVLLSGGELFDPQDTSSTYIKRRQWKFRLVDKQIYDLYLRYLGFPNKTTTGQKLFKLHAERLL